MYTTSDKFHSFGESEWTTVFDINNPCSKAKSKPKSVGKKKTNKSRSSTDKSIANDSSSDSENESVCEEPIDIKNKNYFAAGKCLISIKK